MILIECRIGKIEISGPVKISIWRERLDFAGLRTNSLGEIFIRPSNVVPEYRNVSTAATFRARLFRRLT